MAHRSWALICNLGVLILAFSCFSERENLSQLLGTLTQAIFLSIYGCFESSHLERGEEEDGGRRRASGGLGPWLIFSASLEYLSGHCCSVGSIISLKVGFFGYSRRNNKDQENLKDQTSHFQSEVGMWRENGTQLSRISWVSSTIFSSTPSHPIPNSLFPFLRCRYPFLSFTSSVTLAVSLFLSSLCGTWEEYVCHWL